MEKNINYEITKLLEVAENLGVQEDLSFAVNPAFIDKRSYLIAGVKR